MFFCLLFLLAWPYSTDRPDIITIVWNTSVWYQLRLTFCSIVMKGSPTCRNSRRTTLPLAGYLALTQAPLARLGFFLSVSCATNCACIVVGSQVRMNAAWLAICIDYKSRKKTQSIIAAKTNNGASQKIMVAVRTGSKKLNIMAAFVTFHGIITCSRDWISSADRRLRWFWAIYRVKTSDWDRSQWNIFDSLESADIFMVLQSVSGILAIRGNLRGETFQILYPGTTSWYLYRKRLINTADIHD